MKKFIVSVLIFLSACAGPIVPAFAGEPKQPAKKECTPPPPDGPSESGILFRVVASGTEVKGAQCVLVVATNIPNEPDVACVLVGCRDSCDSEWELLTDGVTCLPLTALQGTI